MVEPCCDDYILQSKDWSLRLLIGESSGFTIEINYANWFELLEVFFSLFEVFMFYADMCEDSVSELDSR